MQRDAMPDGTKRSDMFSAMVSMTLPIWRKGKIEPGIRAMAAEKEMAVRDEETLDAEAANAIGGSLASLENFAAVAKLYRTTLIPQAEQSVQSNIEAYQVGKIDFPMLMDSLMATLNFRKEYAGMVGEMHRTKARLEAAVGRELDGAASESRWERTAENEEIRRRGTMSDEKKEGIPQDPEEKAVAGPGRDAPGSGGGGKSRFFPVLSAILGLLLAGVVAFYNVPAFHLLLHPHAGGDNAAKTADKYTCGMHPFILSDKPGNCPICGMTLTKIEGSAAPVVAAGAKSAPAATPSGGARKILFYRNPMNPNVTSQTPAKDEMGMDFVPVYEDEAKGSGRRRFARGVRHRSGGRGEGTAVRDPERDRGARGDQPSGPGRRDRRARRDGASGASSRRSRAGSRSSTPTSPASW